MLIIQTVLPRKQKDLTRCWPGARGGRGRCPRGHRGPSVTASPWGRPRVPGRSLAQPLPPAGDVATKNRRAKEEGEIEVKRLLRGEKAPGRPGGHPARSAPAHPGRKNREEIRPSPPNPGLLGKASRLCCIPSFLQISRQSSGSKSGSYLIMQFIFHSQHKLL